MLKVTQILSQKMVPDKIFSEHSLFVLKRTFRGKKLKSLSLLTDFISDSILDVYYQQLMEMEKYEQTASLLKKGTNN